METTHKHEVSFSFHNANPGQAAAAAAVGTIVGIAVGKAVVKGVEVAIKMAFPPKTRWQRMKAAW